MAVVTSVSVEYTPGTVRILPTTTFVILARSDASISATKSQRPKTAERCDTPLISLSLAIVNFSRPDARRMSTSPVTIIPPLLVSFFTRLTLPLGTQIRIDAAVEPERSQRSFKSDQQGGLV